MRNVFGTCSLEVFGTLISQADKFFEENESASFLPKGLKRISKLMSFVHSI